LHLIEQPDILDSNHGLVGKRGYQLDLLGGEGLYLGSCQRHNADGTSLPKERDPERRPESTELLRFVPSEVGISQNIRKVNHSGFECGSSNDRPSPRPYGMLLQEGLELLRAAMISSQTI